MYMISIAKKLRRLNNTKKDVEMTHLELDINVAEHMQTAPSTRTKKQ